ncbi:sensor histidine kinase [Campylobacter curvus]|uniref:histidine kinase n=1 Tax=Campylobacter curvus (strain 525.92) TaxID=360105 RepID=A7GW84_CAMC5|nr:HAMP domain-containing sensor histidine kinase [Campylobacter curvus]EAU00606.1 two-component system sensor histidine kinase [Campylobacter curvus 525.92]
MSKITAKTKSLIFVLTLMIILSSSQIYQNSIFYETYIKQIHISYQKSFENFYKSFLNNEFDKYRPLASYFTKKEIIKELKNNNNTKIMKELNFYFSYFKSRDKFLKNVFFIDKDLKFKISKNMLIFNENNFLRYSIYQNKITYENNAIFDVIENNKELEFVLVFGIFEKGRNLGFIEVVLDPNALLKNLQYFDGSIGFIVKNQDNIKFGGQTIDTTSDHSRILIKENSFIINNFIIKNINDEEMAKGIFLLDITSKDKFYDESILKNIIFSLIFFVLAIISLNFVFNFLISRLERSNLILNKKIDIALKKARQQDKLLIYQSKLAGTGEMIANIAHQWRQPLMQLSSILMLLEALFEKNKLTKELFYEKINEESNIINYMSGTIDDFRNFYRPDKEKESFNVMDAIVRSFAIIKSSLDANNIKFDIICKKENAKIYGYKNEFSQAILNILSNSKDAFLNSLITNKSIRVDISNINKTIKILIQDNAGGIDENIIDKIFDPYFTTKHSFQGTGIGLYMSKMIIVDNMNGTIKVCNQELDGKIGAKFEISFNDL